MKILTIIPPHVPSYFNAGHHLPVFQTATYLAHHFPNYTIDSIDAAVLNFHWKNMCDVLVKRYDIIFVFCDFDGVDSLERFSYYVRNFNTASKIVLFGRLCKQCPEFFLKYDIDAIHHRGDYELGLHEYIKHYIDQNYLPNGFLFKNGYRSDEFDIFQPEEWIMADVNRIPYAEYNRMYSNDLDKFCGIPQRQELVVPVARGCPINCSFCDVPFMQGKRERRYDVSKTIEYLKASFAQLPFQYVTFYSPTFTLNHIWVEELCNKLLLEDRLYPWKCTTALPTLNEELVKLMAKAGCVRISLGIESFSPHVSIALPKCKQESYGKFKDIVTVCENNGIELNCFIILGLEGDTPEEAEYTMSVASKYGARVRPTVYCPYHLITADMDKSEIFKFNRQIMYKRNDLSEEDISKYYQLFYNNKLDQPTKVMEKI